MQSLGLRPMLVPLASIDDGINAVRRTLPLCVFHPRCEDGGISALEQYRREWDDEKKAFRASAVHDWTIASRGCLSVSLNELAGRPAARDTRCRSRQGWRIPPPDEPRRVEGSGYDRHCRAAPRSHEVMAKDAREAADEIERLCERIKELKPYEVVSGEHVEGAQRLRERSSGSARRSSNLKPTCDRPQRQGQKLAREARRNMMSWMLVHTKLS